MSAPQPYQPIQPSANVHPKSTIQCTIIKKQSDSASPQELLTSTQTLVSSSQPQQLPSNSQQHHSTFKQPQPQSQHTPNIAVLPPPAPLKPMSWACVVTGNEEKQLSGQTVVATSSTMTVLPPSQACTATPKPTITEYKNFAGIFTCWQTEYRLFKTH